MENKKIKGKAIYQPKGKAAEYAEWACNFYVGCSNGCTYCYLKKGRGANILGGDKPTLKKGFKNEEHALEVFERELKANLSELQENGLFFSFTTDPMLPETQVLTMNAAGIAAKYGISVKILTKCASWVKNFIWWIDNSNSDNAAKEWRRKYAFGFTLTGHDELEPNASTNRERIEAMEKLYKAGFKTFASIEPIIDIRSSVEIILMSVNFCNLYKIGLLSGGSYDRREILNFIGNISLLTAFGTKIYFKDSLLKQAGVNRYELPSFCVDSNYNMFK